MFKCVFTIDPKFRIGFPLRVDLRFAVLLPLYLSLPMSVVRALRHERCRHVLSEQGRCAAFALGTSRIESSVLNWYVFTLQSDLAFSKISSAREYVRGWRKAIFARIVNQAIKQGVNRLFLSPSVEVYRATVLSRSLVPDSMPEIWQVIYDRTANEFGMKKIFIDEPMNIQTLPRRRPCPSTEFFELSLNHKFQNELKASGDLP